jgi:hypothetical protein
MLLGDWFHPTHRIQLSTGFGDNPHSARRGPVLPVHHDQVWVKASEASVEAGVANDLS